MCVTFQEGFPFSGCVCLTCSVISAVWSDNSTWVNIRYISIRALQLRSGRKHNQESSFLVFYFTTTLKTPPEADLLSTAAWPAADAACNYHFTPL